MGWCRAQQRAPRQQKSGGAAAGRHGCGSTPRRSAPAGRLRAAHCIVHSTRTSHLRPADVPVLFSRGPYLSVATHPPLQVAQQALDEVTIMPCNMRIMLHRPEATQQRRWRAAGKIAGTGTPPQMPPAMPPGCLALSTAAWATGRRPPPSGAAAPLLSSSSPRALVGPKHRTVHLFVQIRTRQGGCQGAMRSS